MVMENGIKPKQTVNVLHCLLLFIARSWKTCYGRKIFYNSGVCFSTAYLACKRSKGNTCQFIVFNFVLQSSDAENVNLPVSQPVLVLAQ